ncbi:MAG: alpha/beta fold hydrolase [Dehalococcoidia bacterium]
MTPPLYTRYLGDHIPNCRTLIIQGAGHSVMIEKADETNKAIEEFLRSLI